jgi:acrylyl-CoA reductase (NADPH)
MEEQSFRALLVREGQDGAFHRNIETRSIADLPEGDLLMRVRYSSLNYKDALSATGNKGVTRIYPHTPGVDAAGEVVVSYSNHFSPGDELLITGYDLGMNTPGGFGQFIRVPAKWAVRRPEELTLRQCMAYGSAGFTAAQCLLRLLEAGVEPAQGPVLVTGATGGVGCMAVALLARAGFRVIAATGKPEQSEFLQNLGAHQVIPRHEVDDSSGRPLLSGRWAAAVDTVGGTMLATAIKATQYGGMVAACGNVASGQLAMTVYPFILRGVSLLGIDSANAPLSLRERIWQKLAGEWKVAQLDDMASVCTLDALDREIEIILQGKQVGRVVVDLWA